LGPSPANLGVAVGKAGESGRTLPLLVAGAVGEVDPDGLGELVGAAGGADQLTETIRVHLADGAGDE